MRFWSKQKFLDMGELFFFFGQAWDFGWNKSLDMGKFLLGKGSFLFFFFWIEYFGMIIL